MPPFAFVLIALRASPRSLAVLDAVYEVALIQLTRGGVAPSSPPMEQPIFPHTLVPLHAVRPDAPVLR